MSRGRKATGASQRTLAEFLCSSYRSGPTNKRREEMKTFCKFPSVSTPILIAGFFVAVFFGWSTNWSLADQTAFAEEAALAAEPQAGKAQAAEKMSPPPCEDPPVLCVGVDVSQVPFPGCTSGQRCTVATTGKSCGMAGAGTKCQTVNNGSGACTCKCIQ